MAYNAAKSISKLLVCWTEILVYEQIGNPLLEFNTDFNSRGEYFWSHGLISDATYDLFNTVCNYSQIRRQAQKGALTPDCSRVISQASNEIGRLIDSYDVTLDVCLSTDLSQSKILDKTVRTNITLSHIFDSFSTLTVCYTFFDLSFKFSISSMILWK